MLIAVVLSIDVPDKTVSVVHSAEDEDLIKTNNEIKPIKKSKPINILFDVIIIFLIL